MDFPLVTLAATISSDGITAPAYADVLTSLRTSFAQIYGADVYLGDDTMDGQMLSIVAKAIYDSNLVAIAVYNAFSPATAQGVGLSSVVKINGIKRNVPSNSQVDVTIGGTNGTQIINGIVGDANGNQWALPGTVVIPSSSSIIVTATCTQPGAVQAGVATVTQIVTPTKGWASVTNASIASAGAPVETDAALRRRQTLSVALPALTVIEATVAAISALDGVTQVSAQENPTNAVDANNLPPHSVAFIVLGGDATEIAQVIAKKKTPGTTTYGTTSIAVVDSVGIAQTINFFVPLPTPIKVSLTIASLPGYVSTTGDAIKQAIADYINNLGIGADVYISALFIPAQLYGSALASQFNVIASTVRISYAPAATGTADLGISYSHIATCALSDIALTVT